MQLFNCFGSNIQEGQFVKIFKDFRIFTEELSSKVMLQSCLKRKFDNGIAETKYKNTRFVKQLFNPMKAQELQDLEEVSTIWVKI